MTNSHEQRDRKCSQEPSHKAARVRRHVDSPVEEPVHEINDDAEQNILNSGPCQKAVHRGDQIRPEQSKHRT